MDEALFSLIELWDTLIRKGRRKNTRLTDLAAGVTLFTHPDFAKSVTINHQDNDKVIINRPLAEVLLNYLKGEHGIKKFIFNPRFAFLDGNIQDRVKNTAVFYISEDEPKFKFRPLIIVKKESIGNFNSIISFSTFKKACAKALKAVY